ncbi:MAG: glycosyltransferase [Eubacterium sp.]|nr:glycosyltransferase [Eubacterium sp.]
MKEHSLYKKAKELYKAKKYDKALLMVNQLIEETSPELAYQVLKGQCELELGTMKTSPILWSSMDYKNPTQTDFEALELTRQYLLSCGVTDQAKRFANIARYARGENEDDEEELTWIAEFDPDKIEHYGEISKKYFWQNDVVLATGYELIGLIRQGRKPNSNAILRNTDNMYQFMTMYDTFAVVLDEKEHYDRYMAFAMTLAVFGKRVIFVTLPVEVEITERPKDLENYIQLSLENMEIIDGVEVYVPLHLILEGEFYESTTLALVDYLSKQTSKTSLPLFADLKALSRMRSNYVSRKILHYVCRNTAIKNAQSDTCFAYVNGYGIYESILFGTDFDKALYREAKHALSIVLPVRNNAETIGATLKTCLEQDYTDYEILISDNSDNDRYEIYDLVKQMDSEKIRYIRTPRVLPITKSFEYAYLNALGDFIMPIGADDGVNINALSRFMQIKALIERETKKKTNILSWDRIHYCWPNMTSSGQQDQLIIPKPYRLDGKWYEEKTQRDMLDLILCYPKTIYSLPVSYINSGMSRRYMQEIYEKTDALIDGHSQDLYTGVLNVALNESYYHINLPITIAALSGHSSGAASIAGAVKREIALAQGREEQLTNISFPTQRDIEDILYPSDGDVANMVCQVLRLIDMEVLPVSTLKRIPWEIIGKAILGQVQYKDVNKTKVLHQLIDSIRVFSSEAADILQKEVTTNTRSVAHYEVVDGKFYYQGFQKNGGIAMDASEFAVKDVYDAAKLVQRLTHLF